MVIMDTAPGCSRDSSMADTAIRATGTTAATVGTGFMVAAFTVVGMGSEAVAAKGGTAASREWAAVAGALAVAGAAVAVAADNAAAWPPDSKIEAGRSAGRRGLRLASFLDPHRRETLSAARVSGKRQGLIGPVASRKAAIARLSSAQGRRNPTLAAYVIWKHPGAFACHGRPCQFRDVAADACPETGLGRKRGRRHRPAAPGQRNGG